MPKPNMMDNRCRKPDCLCRASTSKKTTYSSVPAASPWRTTATRPVDPSAAPPPPHCTSTMPMAMPTGVTTANVATYMTNTGRRVLDQASSSPMQKAMTSLCVATATNRYHTLSTRSSSPMARPSNTSWKDSASTANRPRNECSPPAADASRSAVFVCFSASPPSRWRELCGRRLSRPIATAPLPDDGRYRLWSSFRDAADDDDDDSLSSSLMLPVDMPPVTDGTEPGDDEPTAAALAVTVATVCSEARGIDMVRRLRLIDRCSTSSAELRSAWPAAHRSSTECTTSSTRNTMKNPAQNIRSPRCSNPWPLGSRPVCCNRFTPSRTSGCRCSSVVNNSTPPPKHSSSDTAGEPVAESPPCEWPPMPQADDDDEADDADDSDDDEDDEDDGFLGRRHHLVNFRGTTPSANEPKPSTSMANVLATVIRFTSVTKSSPSPDTAVAGSAVIADGAVWENRRRERRLRRRYGACWRNRVLIRRRADERKRRSVVKRHHDQSPRRTRVLHREPLSKRPRRRFAWHRSKTRRASDADADYWWVCTRSVRVAENVRTASEVAAAAAATNDDQLVAVATTTAAAVIAAAAAVAAAVTIT